jgi:hypothetical protein
LRSLDHAAPIFYYIRFLRHLRGMGRLAPSFKM